MLATIAFVEWKKLVAKYNLWEHLKYVFCNIFERMCREPIKGLTLQNCMFRDILAQLNFGQKLHLAFNCTHKLILATKSTCTRRYKDM